MKISEVFDNIGIKLICLLLAIVMWLYANEGFQIVKPSDRKKMTFHEVPVQLTGLPQGQWKPKPGKISLEVKYSTAEITASTLQAVVSLIPEDGAKRQVVLTAENVKLPRGMDFVKAEPDKIKLVKSF